MTFEEYLETDKDSITEKTMKYKKLASIIAKLVDKKMLKKKSTQELYDTVVDEYLDMGDNPDDASEQDVVEIADASDIQ